MTVIDIYAWDIWLGQGTVNQGQERARNAVLQGTDCFDDKLYWKE